MYDNFQKILNAKHYTIADVARGTGISKSTFSQWKNGQINLKTEKIVRIAEFLGVSVDYLTTGDNAPVYVMPEYDPSELSVIEKYGSLNENNKIKVMDYLTNILLMQKEYDELFDIVENIKNLIDNEKKVAFPNVHYTNTWIHNTYMQLDRELIADNNTPTITLSINQIQEIGMALSSYGIFLEKLQDIVHDTSDN